LEDAGFQFGSQELIDDNDNDDTIFVTSSDFACTVLLHVKYTLKINLIAKYIFVYLCLIAIVQEHENSIQIAWSSGERTHDGWFTYSELE